MLESPERASLYLGYWNYSNSMEKNGNSTNNKPPPRSGSAGPVPGESKPKTDGKNGTGSKQRFNRKREPTYPKPEYFSGPVRRPNPQKGKAFDKRPPQRGGTNRQYGCPGGGRREEVAEVQRAEFSPAQFTGPKKINLNHLLNFSFEPRGQGSSGADCNGGWGRRNKWGHKMKPFNKELFLQANCQFVVSEDQDYTAHFADPDTLVNWSFIQQVRIYSHEVPSCPICLYPPVAAKITRCGHIFCWACILHYLSLSEKTWSKCPICYEAVHKTDLKSVVAMETRQYQAGDTITMQLMRREKGVLVALPHSRWMKVEEPIHLGDDLHSQYSKLLLASQAQVLQQVVEVERASLQKQYMEEEHTLESCFIESALLELKERENALLAAYPSNEVDLKLEALNINPASLEVVPTKVASDHIPAAKPVLQYSSAFDDEVVDPVFEENISEGLSHLDPKLIPEPELKPVPCSVVEKQLRAEQSESVSDSSVNVPYYYFYQAEDGQQMFLHPINVRCLVHEYGSLEKSPEKIEAVVVEIDGYSMNEEMRRRHRYLSHLPLTCEFSICELALQPPLLSKETLLTFTEDIEKRKRFRQKKARDERRREWRIEMEENKKQGKYPEVHIGLENLQQFPAFGSPPLDHSHHSNISHLSTGIASSPPSDCQVLFPCLGSGSPQQYGKSLEEDAHCPSFAQMLREGKAKADGWPKTAPIKAESLLALPAPDSDGESDGSDRAPVPNFQNSFSQAFEAALLQLDKIPGPPPGLVGNAGDKSGKKKKKKQKLLFSTSVVHTK